jgi:type II secretory ATPase GspE/PulE/Tfp pilus assembly ATPase PilB-like protein
VVGIVAQRLVRQICPHCRIEKEPTLQERAAYREAMGQELVSCYVGEGCNFCGQTGYLGRTGVFEVLTVGDSIRELLLRSASASEMKAEATQRGMIPMRRDGMLKVKQGVTTPSEVMKNVYTLG